MFVLKKRVILCLIIGFLLLSEKVFSQNLETDITANPTVSIPLGPEVDGDLQLFKIGGGLSFQGDIYHSSLPFLYARPSFEFDYLPLNGVASGFTVVAPGLSMGGRYELSSRIVLKAFGGGGLYFALSDIGNVSNPFIAAGAEMNVKLNPALSIGLGARYRQLTTPTGSLHDGISVSLGVGLDLRSQKKTHGMNVIPLIDPIFPLFYTYYDKNPAGSVIIKNEESLQYDDLKVSFHANQYMEGYKLCGEVDNLKPGEEISFPVYALFNDSIFRVTEGTKVAGDIKLTYHVLGKQIEQSYPVTVEIQNRNAMTWDDDRKAASFVTAKDPVVLSFSKNTVSLIRSDMAPPISENFRTALALFQTMSVYGIGYAIDPSTPYVALSEDQQSVDFLQFPNQTLSYRAGDCDDLSVLYASLLEAVGVPSAFITTPGHIFIAFDLGISEKNAERFFNMERDVIFHNDKIWLPIEITMVKSGFLDAWRRGAQEWYSAVNNGTEGFYPIQEAWNIYEPVGFVESGMAAMLPTNENIFQSYTGELSEFYDYIVGPQVAQIHSACREKGLSDIETANRVAVFYAQIGMLDRSEKEFRTILRKERHVPSLVNLGNVMYINEKFDEALALYKEAYELKPDNSKILFRTINLLYNRSEYEEAENLMARLQNQDPEMAATLASRYGGSGTTRASEANTFSLDDWAEE